VYINFDVVSDIGSSGNYSIRSCLVIYGIVICVQRAFILASFFWFFVVAVWLLAKMRAVREHHLFANVAKRASARTFDSVASF